MIAECIYMRYLDLDEIYQEWLQSVDMFHEQTFLSLEGRNGGRKRWKGGEEENNVIAKIWVENRLININI